MRLPETDNETDGGGETERETDGDGETDEDGDGEQISIWNRDNENTKHETQGVGRIMNILYMSMSMGQRGHGVRSEK